MSIRKIIVIVVSLFLLLASGCKTRFVEVEKPLTKWQQVKMDAGGIALSTIGPAAIFLVIKLILRIRGIAKK